MKPIVERKKRKSDLVLTVLAISTVLISLILTAMALRSGVTVGQAITEDSLLHSPRFSHATGFYPNVIEVSIINPYPNATVYYTLDGSEPSLDATQYAAPIQINQYKVDALQYANIPTSPVWKAPIEEVFKGIVLKAIIVKENHKSKITAATYFIHPEGRARYSLPVMLLTVNPDDFFSFERGIYVRGRTFEDKNYYIKTKRDISQNKWWYYPSNYTRRGIEWERPVHISYLEKNSNQGIETSAGVRIHGNATRGYSQKSLKIHFRDKYGAPEFKYDFFNGKGTMPLKSFLLRNSGQDLMSTMFRDALVQEIFHEFKLDKQAYQPSILFINGEYWGIHNIRERLDEDYLSIKYKMPLDSFAIIKPDGTIQFGPEGGGLSYQKMITYAENNNLADSIHYNHIASQIDIDNFINYLIAEIYVATQDWPHNNMEMWRYLGNVKDSSVQEKDGRWRWMLFDTDPGMGLNYPVSSKSIDYVLNSKALGNLFESLLKNTEFRETFITRFNYHLDSTLKPDRVIGIIERMQSVLAPEIEEHIDRWRTIESYTTWEKNVNNIKDFARKRPYFIKQQLQTLQARLDKN